MCELVSIVRKLIWILLVFGFPATSYSDEGSRPVCTGYNPLNDSWGFKGPARGIKEYVCPDGWGVLGTSYPEFSKLIPGRHSPSIVCCPLMVSDLISDRHTWEGATCGDEEVVTGIRADDRNGLSFRCSEINKKKYELAEPGAGAAWGVSSSFAYPWMEDEIKRIGEIPASVRHAFQRAEYSEFVNHGCAADPIGGLLVGAVSERCKGLRWRQVRIKAKTGAEARRQDLSLISSCRRVSSVFDKSPSCLD